MLSAISHLKEVGQFHATGPGSLESNWANSELSAAPCLKNTGPSVPSSTVPTSCHLSGKQLGQLDSIGSAASERLWAIKGPSVASGRRPTPCHRPYLSESSWANSKPSATPPRRNSGPSGGHRYHLAVGQPHAIGNISFERSWPITALYLRKAKFYTDLIKRNFQISLSIAP
jgi:hypothetical protein